MLKIGLTGGIGSGKTTVAKIFAIVGIPVFDADTVAKNILNENKDLARSVIDLFGKDIYTDGLLNRQKLASIVFADPDKLEQLNALVHPVVIDAGNKWMEQQTTPYAIKEAALIFEAGFADDFDYIIGVTAPRPLRLKRAMERDNASREKIISRMDKQMDDEIKMRLCDFVIFNDEQQLLIPQILELNEKLLEIEKRNTC